MKAIKSVFVFCLISFTCLSLSLAAEGTIGWMFKDKINEKAPVKVYIKEIVNQSGQSQIVPEAFRKALEKSLGERRSIKFSVVNSPAESDIEITAVITNFKYLEKGIFKPSPGIGTMLLDAAATMAGNYVEMAVEYAVIDTKSDKTLWKGTISEYIKKKMTRDESIPLIYDAVTRVFIWKCFGKADLRDGHSHDTM